MNKSISKYKMGFLVLRTQRIGTSRKLLNDSGFFKMHIGDVNNRLGASWVKPCASKNLCEQKNLLESLKGRGMIGIATWISDAQWGKNLPETDVQWQRRIDLSLAVNRWKF